MISPSLRGAGGALVPVPPPPDWYRGPGSGVYNRGVSNTTVAHAGNTVYRSPLNVVREAEAGSRWPGDLTKMMFLPDGRLVPATSATVDMFRGAGETVTVLQPASSGSGLATALRALVPAAAMFVGGYAGYRAAQHRKMLGAVGGAVVGGILGAIFK